MKVKYCGSKYIVTLGEKLQIELIKIVLFLKRQKRRIVLLINKEEIYLYIFITVFWLMFAVVTFLFGKAYKSTPNQPYRVQDVLWELKNSYFTSVILAFAINVFNKAQRHRQKMYNQHSLYYNVMCSFDEMLCVFPDLDCMEFMALYCKNTLNDTISIFKRKGRQIQTNDEFCKRIEEILLEIQKIEENINQKRLVYVDDTTVAIYLEDIQNALTEIKKNDFIKTKDLIHVLELGYELIELIRKPWRIDLKLKIKVLSILNTHEENDILGDYYYSMLIEGIRN